MANLVRWNPIDRNDRNARSDGQDFLRISLAEARSVMKVMVLSSMDMMQTDDEVIVEASIPGIKPDDINISVTGDTLTIRGEIKSDEEVKKAELSYARNQARFICSFCAAACPSCIG